MPFDYSENKRLEEIRNDLDESQTEFARRLGMKQGYLSEVERGSKTVKGEPKYVPVSPQIKLILYNDLGVNPDWFEKGTKPKYLKQKKTGDQNKEYIPYESVLPIPLKEPEPEYKTDKPKSWIEEKIALYQDKVKLQEIIISNQNERISELKAELEKAKKGR